MLETDALVERGDMPMAADTKQDELSRLVMENRALRAQSTLLKQFVDIARSSDKDEMLQRTLQKTLDHSVELTGAEKGSLFLLDETGAVASGILTRGETSPDKTRQLIGKVMNKGLAGWVNRHRKPGLILDTEKDERWLQLPDQPYTVRSALAVPIIRSERVLGLLTLLHAKPDHFDAEAAALMHMTADQIAVILDNARLLAELEESYRLLGETKKQVEAYSGALDREMEKGYRIQKDFLPKVIPQPEGWEIAVHLDPAIQVSGDFYDVFPLSADSFGLVIADVCDKGVGSALFMALFRSLIRIFAGRELDRQALRRSGGGKDFNLAAVIEQTGQYVFANHGRLSMFATIFMGILEPADGLLRYVNAGHEPPLVADRQGVKAVLKSSGPAVGLFGDYRYRVEQVRLDAADMLIGFTDGVTEANSPEGELFSRQRLRALIQRPPGSAGRMLGRIRDALKAHTGSAPQSDDITLMILRRK